MERAEHLIEKLRVQIRSGEPVEQLLTTLRVLYAEIRGDVSERGQMSQAGSVAVILPGADDIADPSAPTSSLRPEERVVQPLEVDEKELEEELHAIREAAEFKNAVSVHLPGEGHMSDQANREDPVTAEETGRWTRQAPEGTGPDSLNDRLGSREREVSERLADEQVPDLRKAISLNDRFRFTSGLFQGDHSLYDEAIRNLNGFGSMDQAFRWLEKECFGKLGWKEDDELCIQFVSLVRRRFLST
jgi:hypothetical protein